MKRLLALALLVVTLSFQGQVGSAHSGVLPRVVQVVPECSNCSSADWNSQWHPQHENCTYSPIMGCGFGCNCYMGFLNLPPDGETKSVGASGFFGGAFTSDGGFRVDRPGPLVRVRVKAGDTIYLLNGRKPTKAALRRFTEKAPGRRVLATWNSAGKLSIRLYR